MFKPRLLFTAQKPDDLEQYKGRKILIPEYKGDVKVSELPVTVETIAGHRFKHAFFEINGKHLIGMLRFYAQIHGAKDITEQQFRDFENTQFDAEKNDGKKLLGL